MLVSARDPLINVAAFVIGDRTSSEKLIGQTEHKKSTHNEIFDGKLYGYIYLVLC